MKKTPLYLIIIIITSLFATSCVKEKTVTKKVIQNEYQNNGNPPNGSNDDDDDDEDDSDNGTYIDPYNTSRIILKGDDQNKRGTNIFWSSLYDLPNNLPQSSLFTDSKLNIQVVATNREYQFPGCALTLPYERIKIKVRVRSQQTPNSGEVCTFVSTVGESEKSRGIISYIPPQGTPDPLVIEVIGIAIDYPCNTRPQSCYNNEFVDLSPNSYQDYCIGFEIRYATDDTKNLTGTAKECSIY